MGKKFAKDNGLPHTVFVPTKNATSDKWRVT